MPCLLIYHASYLHVSNIWYSRALIPPLSPYPISLSPNISISDFHKPYITIVPYPYPPISPYLTFTSPISLLSHGPNTQSPYLTFTSPISLYCPMALEYPISPYLTFTSPISLLSHGPNPHSPIFSCPIMFIIPFWRELDSLCYLRYFIPCPLRRLVAWTLFWG